jgi:molecular chaperone GrpE (heat shock protein)
VLRLERELQESRLELAQRGDQVQRLHGELDRARAAAADEATRRAEAEIERLVAAIGAPLTQWVTQAHLQRTGTARIQVEDVLDVGTRLVRSLGDFGVDTISAVGEVVPFDPDRHDPLSMAAAPETARPVVVRMVGLAYRDRVVRKAGVDIADGVS